MSIESVMLSNHLILCCPLLLLPSIFPSISLFQWVGSLNQAAKVLELWLQSFQWIFRADVLKDWLIWTPCSPRDSQESSPALLNQVLKLSYEISQFSSLHLLSQVWLFATVWTAARQASLSITGFWSLLKSCSLSQLFHPTISFSVVPFSTCLQSFPASELFQWIGSLHHVAKVLELQLQHQSFQWTFKTDFL